MKKWKKLLFLIITAIGLTAGGVWYMGKEDKGHKAKKSVAMPKEKEVNQKIKKAKEKIAFSGSVKKRFLSQNKKYNNKWNRYLHSRRNRIINEVIQYLQKVQK